MKQFLIGMILTITLSGIAAFKIGDDDLVLGDRADLTQDKNVQVIDSAGSVLDLIRWDESEDDLLFSKNGTDFTSIDDLGGGAGGINYIDNTDIEEDATGYNTYADVAGENAVDGTGGSASITVAQSADTSLRGANNLLITKDAVNRQGEGVSVDFTIDAADKAEKLTIKFKYSTSANYVDDDIRISIYDVTNARLIRVNGEDLKASSLTPYHYARFQTASDSTSYRLILHQSSVSALAYTVRIDDVQVGPKEISQGTFIGDWIDYTPTIQGLGTVTLDYAKYKVVGDTVHVNIKGDAGTSTATELQVGLPSGLTAHSDYNLTVVGSGNRGSSTDIHYSVLATGGDSFVNMGVRDPSNDFIFTARNGNNVFATGNTFSINFKLKIQGYSSNSKMSSDLGNREIVVEGAGNGGTSITANVTDIDFTETRDTTSSWSGTQFTAPETGDYSFEGSMNLTGATTSRVRTYIDTGSGATFDKEVSSGGINSSLQAFSGKVFLNKGDILSFRCEDSVTLSNSTSGHHLFIKKDNSKQTNFESSGIYFSAFDDAGASIASVITATFDNVELDSHGAYSAGVYTIPETGFYESCSSFGISETVADGDQLSVNMRIDGTERSIDLVEFQAAGTRDATVKTCYANEMVKGTTIDNRVLGGTGDSLITNEKFNTWTIKRIK